MLCAVGWGVKTTKIVPLGKIRFLVLPPLQPARWQRSGSAVAAQWQRSGSAVAAQWQRNTEGVKTTLVDGWGWHDAHARWTWLSLLSVDLLYHR